VNCDELRELLLDYIGGELVVEQCRTIEVHIIGCQDCTIRIETYRHTVRLARALPRCDKLPASVEERLRRVLEAELGAE
jgi:hypothetical protein